MFECSITVPKMAGPVRLLTAMMQIDLLHNPINAEIMIADCHPDLRIFCFSGGCD